MFLSTLTFLHFFPWVDGCPEGLDTFIFFYKCIAGDCKATALKAEVWVEMVAEGGRRFMATWRK